MRVLTLLLCAASTADSAEAMLGLYSGEESLEVGIVALREATWERVAGLVRELALRTAPPPVVHVFTSAPRLFGVVFPAKRR